MGGSRFLRWAGSTMGRSCMLAVAMSLTVVTALEPDATLPRQGLLSLARKVLKIGSNPVCDEVCETCTRMVRG